MKKSGAFSIWKTRRFCIVETPGVEPGSDKEIDKTSTCLAKRLDLTASWQFGQPSYSDSG